MRAAVGAACALHAARRARRAAPPRLAAARAVRAARAVAAAVSDAAPTRARRRGPAGGAVARAVAAAAAARAVRLAQQQLARRAVAPRGARARSRALVALAVPGAQCHDVMPTDAEGMATGAQRGQRPGGGVLHDRCAAGVVVQQREGELGHADGRRVRHLHSARRQLHRGRHKLLASPLDARPRREQRGACPRRARPHGRPESVAGVLGPQPGRGALERRYHALLLRRGARANPQPSACGDADAVPEQHQHVALLGGLMKEGGRRPVVDHRRCVEPGSGQ